ncbi:site-specific integrase [Acidipila sp. EB88]|uniref:tyrosine-type recombinase/integrase n=1 Tax=Acidipila sp. EB88 TaxID=2305226 RepID=UPI000F5F12BE|nr:site-specific integrase [Acidipila sp. EB88]RRA47621.1 site-specific integrase [Acidipila sp. EB88]
MKLTRESFQVGSLTKEPRKHGDVWIYRWRQASPAGAPVQKKIIVGPCSELRSKSQAQKAVQAMNLQINSAKSSSKPLTLGQLVKHYAALELGMERSNKTDHTCDVYRDCLKNHIVPRWGTELAASLRAPDVEAWLRSLPLANSSKAKLRNVMSVVYNHGIRHGLVDANPIIGLVKGSGVRQSATRRKSPQILTADEIKRLLCVLEDPYRAMVYLLASTGLRFSELRGLQWQDLDVKNLALLLTRSVVKGSITPMKNAASRRPVSITPDVCRALQALRQNSPYRGGMDWIFASIKAGGNIPLWGNSVMEDHVRPALKVAGIEKHVSWHTFRHTFATLLKASGADVKTVQESLRHATSAMTMDVYVQPIPAVVRAAQLELASTFTPDSWTGAVPVPNLFPDSGSASASC